MSGNWNRTGFDQAVQYIEKNAEPCQMIVVNLTIRALSIFEHCNATHDFCMQNLASDRISWGSCNRVFWNSNSGWAISDHHCNKEFYDKATAFIANW